MIDSPADLLARLDEVRHRLNRRTLILGVSVVASIALTELALLVWIALRHSAEAFALAAYTSAAALLAVSGAVFLLLRTRWSSVDDTAQLVDRRAGMKNRVATALWLTRLRPPPRLAGAVINDALSRSPEWSPRRIVTRAVPRIAFLPLGALALLLGTAILAPRIAPEMAAFPGSQPAPPQETRTAKLDALRQHEREHLGSESVEGQAVDGPGRSSRRSGVPNLPSESERGRGAAAKEASGPSEDTTSGPIPGRLRGAIRRTLGIERDGDGETHPGEHQLARHDAGSNDDRGEDPGSRGKRNDPNSPEGGDPGTEKANRRGARPYRENEQRASGAERALSAGKTDSGAARKRAGDQDGNRPGSTQKAGVGSSPDTLFAREDSKGKPAGLFAEPPQAEQHTFRLSLTSFLRPHDAAAPPERPAAASLATGADEPQNEPGSNQIGDDAVRRAPVPPGYEDVVRRVYSARPE